MVQEAIYELKKQKNHEEQYAQEAMDHIVDLERSQAAAEGGDKAAKIAMKAAAKAARRKCAMVHCDKVGTKRCGGCKVSGGTYTY
jgi:hypothetical protein